MLLKKPHRACIYLIAKNFNISIPLILKLNFQHHYYRNHYNILICCSKTFIIIIMVMLKTAEVYLMNGKFLRTAYKSLCNIISITIDLI